MSFTHQREEQRYGPHRNGYDGRPERKRKIGLAQHDRTRPLCIGGWRTLVFFKVKPHLGVAVILRSGLKGLQDKNCRHDGGQKSARLEGELGHKRHAYHYAENCKRGEPASAQHGLVGNTTHFFHGHPRPQIGELIVARITGHKPADN